MKNTFKNLRTIASKLVIIATLVLGLNAVAQAQTVDPANPWGFEKKALKPDGTPWTGPVNVGDIVKYVLSYKPSTTPSGPVTIDDTLSPNLTYVAPTTGPGWTWSSSPYSVGNHEQYKSTGFGPGTSISATLTIKPVIAPVSSGGDGFLPIPVGNKLYGVFHHNSTGSGTKNIACWNLNDLSSCGVQSIGLITPTLVRHIVEGTKIYFPAVKDTGSNFIPGVGC